MAQRKKADFRSDHTVIIVWHWRKTLWHSILLQSDEKFVVIDCAASDVRWCYITRLSLQLWPKWTISYKRWIFLPDKNVFYPFTSCLPSSAHSSPLASFKPRTSCRWTQAAPPILTLKSCSYLTRRRSTTPKSTRRHWTLSSTRHLYSRWVVSEDDDENVN